MQYNFMQIARFQVERWQDIEKAATEMMRLFNLRDEDQLHSIAIAARDANLQASLEEVLKVLNELVGPST